MTSSTTAWPSTLDFYRADKPEVAKSVDPTKAFNEKLNGRVAMMGLVIGLATEALTGKGIVEQVWSFNQATAGIDFSFIVNFFSWTGEKHYLIK